MTQEKLQKMFNLAVVWVVLEYRHGHSVPCGKKLSNIQRQIIAHRLGWSIDDYIYIPEA